MTRRYEEYPQLARLVRAMSPEGRELVAHWHRVLTTALEGYIPHAEREVKATWGNQAMKRVGAEGAELGLAGWLNVMRKVAELVDSGGAGDWCCKPGMLASPNSCPQHGYDSQKEGSYELGTIIRRPYGEGSERAVKVYDNSSVPFPWRSVEFPLSYNWADLRQGQWTVIGRV